MSMLSAQRDELRWLADNLEEHDSHMDEYVQAMRSAAVTIWELRNKMCDMVDERERARVLEADNAKLRELLLEAYGTARGLALNDPLADVSWLADHMREMGIEVTT